MMDTKLKPYTTASVVLYGAEGWDISARSNSKFMTTEMYFLTHTCCKISLHRGRYDVIRQKKIRDFNEKEKY